MQQIAKKNNGFSLIEVLVVIAIIDLLGSIVIFNVAFTTKKGRDTKRIADLTTIGRFLAGGECRDHSLGDGVPIDLTHFANELVVANPQYAQFISQIPKDPQSGSNTESNYFYVKVGSTCVIYANLENEDSEITLTTLTNPTAGGGQGVLEGSANGVNGTKIYFQFSN
jgi:prepilin-type N-terminal cleavage/methylation domain-containing protein